MSDEEDSDYGAPAYSPLSANSPLSDISGRLWHDTASLDDISGIDEDLVLDNEDSSTAQEMQLSPDIEESSALEVQQFANDEGSSATQELQQPPGTDDASQGFCYIWLQNRRRQRRQKC